MEGRNEESEWAGANARGLVSVMGRGEERQVLQGDTLFNVYQARCTN